MKYQYENDKILAMHVCDKYQSRGDENSEARHYIQAKYYKLLLSISHKFVHYSSENYNPNQDYDKVLNAYEWLSNKLINLCCKYKNLDKSQLDTFLKASIYSRYTKIEWCKHDFKEKYKVEEYTPKCIKSLPDKEQKIFKLLFRRKSIEQISSSCNIDLEESQLLTDKIHSILNLNNKSYLLNNYIYNTVGIEDLYTDIDESQNADLENEANELKIIINDSINSISSGDKKLLIMYWCAGMNAEKIITYVKNSDLDDLPKINIDKDVYKSITRISSQIDNYINNKYFNYYADYNLNMEKIKRMLKEYFSYIYESADDILFYKQLQSIIMK